MAKIWGANYIQESMNGHLLAARHFYTWKRDSVRAEGLSLWLCVTTNILLVIFFFFPHQGIHSNIIIYDGYVIIFEQVGVGEEELSDLDFFVGLPFQDGISKTTNALHL